jgi:hypothetical protein
MSNRGPRILRPYRQFRSLGYATVRAMGNWQPWLELGLSLLGDGSPYLAGKKIIRRYIYRRIGSWMSRELFGRGLGAKAIKHLLGL